MNARRIDLESVEKATEVIDSLGSNNSKMMATRAIHINVFVEQVPGHDARFIKTVYNDIGAEVAISSQAYYEEEGAVTDMVVMGTVYQHREVRRILIGNPKIQPWVDAIWQVVESSYEYGY